jgi:hypothetical protein
MEQKTNLKYELCTEGSTYTRHYRVQQKRELVTLLRKPLTILIR